MSRRVNPPPGECGVTLVELVIAILVLSLGTVATFRAIDQSRRVTGDATVRFLALQVALNHSEDLRVLSPEAAARLPAAVAMGGHDWRLAESEQITAAGFAEITVNVTAEGLPGAQLVAYRGGRAP